MVVVSLAMTACSPTMVDPTPTATRSAETRATELEPAPTATSIPPVTFTVCTAKLPAGLSLYDGVQTRVKANIHSMIYDRPFDLINGELVPVLLETVPTQANGDLRLMPVAVRSGQTVVDARGELVVLKNGVRVRPSGCRQADCVIEWDGVTPLEMNQMRLTFELREGLTWSDGERVTASDSVFSFDLGSAPEAPGLRWAEERTDSYVAVDQKTVQWMGRPGFTTAHIERFFWQPLPSHLFSGAESWAELSEAEALTSSPLSYGPFILTSWDPTSMQFKPNPYYYRRDENLFQMDTIIFRVVDDGAAGAWGALQSGDCDMLDSSFGMENDPQLLETIGQDARFEVIMQEGNDWTQLVFGIQTAADHDRPDFFGDVRTRQAFAACLDRDAMMETTMDGLVLPWPSFLPASVSQLAPVDRIAQDLEFGIASLEEVGWRDHDGDPETPLQAWGVANLQAGMPLVVELLINTSGFQRDLADIIQHSLQQCGIAVNVRALPAPDLYAPGPEGPLFGRAFDLALLSWQSMPEPDCGYYYRWRIPSGDNYWVGSNLAGLVDEAYDHTCSTAALALPEEYLAALQSAERAFVTSLPAVPIFAPPTVIVLPSQNCAGDDLFTNPNFFSGLLPLVGVGDCP
jgi:peptide/nickel transport system substrate-binding protein